MIPFKPVTNNTVNTRATAALKVQKRIKELSATLEEDKIFFRDLAAGEKFKVDVPGIGSVSVSAPPAAKSGETVVFDEDKYNNLPSDTKLLLQTLGVITVQKFSKPAGTPSVTFTLNT